MEGVLAVRIGGGMRSIILKADDLRLEQLTEGWKRFLQFCKGAGVFCNVGVISGSLVGVAKAQISEIRAELNGLGINRTWALWNHGLDHKRQRGGGTSDFRGSPLTRQIRALRLTQEAVEGI